MNPPGPPSEPTVFVVDDDLDLREAMRWLVQSVGLAVETYPSAEAFLAAYCTDRPGCLVLDLRMPGMGGLRLLEQLKRCDRPILPTIVLTGHGNVPLAVSALKLGAVDFIEKPAIDWQLLDRIQEALAADRAWRIRTEEIGTADAAFHQLTHREREVLERLVAGQSNKAIGLSLGISERTVEKFRKNIMQKTKANSLATLVQMFLLHRQSVESTPHRS